MPFVLDTSVAAYWAFEDENHPAAALALERIRTDEAVVPSIWWFEVRNTLNRQ
jgi:predicted nucleic acid-binding protein